MSDCTDCRLAAARVWHGHFWPCSNCCARAIARSLPFWSSRRAGKQLPEYRALLAAHKLTHEQVLDARRRDWLQCLARTDCAAQAAQSTREAYASTLAPEHKRATGL